MTRVAAGGGRLRAARPSWRGWPLLAGLTICTVAVAACGNPVAPQPTSLPHRQTPGAGFHGLVQFTGAPQTNNPSIVGGVISLDWGELEPQEGSFDWSAIDSAMSVWTTHGKKVAIRVQTYVPHRSATPSWVYSLGVRQVDWPDGSVAPVYWDRPFLDAWQAFLEALASRYDGNPSLLWFQAGVGVYGETKVDIPHGGVNPLTLWESMGYTDRGWFGTIQELAEVAASAFVRTPVAVAVDKSFIGSTRGYTESTVVDWLVKHGLWPQDDGLGSDTHYRDPSWNAPHLAEQLLSTSSTGDDLSTDIAAGLRTHATYIILYGSDISNPVYQPVLAEAAAEAS